MLGEEVDMNVYDDVDNETDEYDQTDDAEQLDEAVATLEDEFHDAYEINNLDNDDLPDFDGEMEQIDETNNFLFEEFTYEDFDEFTGQNWQIPRRPRRRSLPYQLHKSRDVHLVRGKS